ncbi:hypothetical protein FGO68_gene2113 [Halteria grandinella]|uniref:Secreted protein n=1 Tax=Halteria grandinella TaxID=5974 RepID=A0A8J8NNP0_HALGN|nr:hypothetical protein FGO68_gene2113 [Halteria grandinella]
MKLISLTLALLAVGKVTAISADLETFYGLLCQLPPLHRQLLLPDHDGHGPRHAERGQHHRLDLLPPGIPDQGVHGHHRRLPVLHHH